MIKTTLRIAALATTLAAALAGCTTEPLTGTAARPIIETPCATDAACPTGFECEIEVEHGVTTSFCQAHDEIDEDDTSGACPAGYELEIEHGQSYCKPHGGDDTDAGAGSGSGSGSGSDDNTGSTGTGTTGATCATDAECAVGYECEVEIEHGVTTSTCQLHGGV